MVKDLLIDLKSLAQDLEFERRVKQTSSASETPAHSSAVQTSPRRADVARTDEVDAAPTLISKPSLSSIVKPRRWPTVALIALVVLGLSFAAYKLWTRAREVTPPVAANIMRVTAWSGLDTQPTLAPDGKSVAYSSNHGGSFEIYVKQLTQGGREIQLTNDGKENFQPAWSGDGQQIAYFSMKGGGIWVIPTLGGSPRQLTDFGASPKWSHDGSMLAFNSDSNPDLGTGNVGSSTIWIVPAQGGAPRQVTKVGSPAGGHVAPNWSPDDRKIIFLALNFSTQVLWSTSVDGGDPKQLTDKMLGKVAHQVFSTDGRWIYFDSGPLVQALPVSPQTGLPLGQPVKLVDVGVSFISSLSLSSDGKRLAQRPDAEQ